MTTSGGITSTTFYVRDLQGNIMAVYEETGSELSLIEQPIYGSDRIGKFSPFQ